MESIKRTIVSELAKAIRIANGQPVDLGTSLVSSSSTTPTAQAIYYGCPGTGKSYEVKKIAEGEDGEKIIWYEQATQTDKSCKKFEGIPTDEQKKS